MVAPRRLVVEMGNKDELFRSDKTIKTCESVKEYYKYFNNLENFKLIVFDGNHKVDKNDEGLQFFFEGLL